MRRFRRLAFLFFFSSSLANAQTESHSDAGAPSLRNVIESLRSSPSGFEAFKSVNDFGESCRNIKAAVSCVQSAFTGLKDGLLGDVDTFKFAAKESARLAISSSLAGQLALRLLNKKTTADKLREQVEKLGPSAKEALPMFARLATDPAYQIEIAQKVSGILGTFVKKSADEGLNLKCDEIQDSLCKVLGQVGYEALTSLVFAAATIEVGGAGGFAKIALLLPKLAKQYPKLKPLIVALYKLADELKGVSKVAKGAEHAIEAPGARFARARARVKGASRFVKSDAEALRRSELLPKERLHEIEDLLGRSIGDSGEQVAEKLNQIHEIGKHNGTKAAGYFRDPTTGELRSTLSPQQIAAKKKLAAELGLKPSEIEKLLDSGYLGDLVAAPKSEASFAAFADSTHTIRGGVPERYPIPEKLQAPLETYLNTVRANQKKIDEVPGRIEKIKDEIDLIYYDFNSEGRVKELERELKRLENPLNLAITRGGSDARAFDEALKASPDLAAHVKSIEEKVFAAANHEMAANGFEVPKTILNAPARVGGSATSHGGSVMGAVYRRELPDGRIESVQKIYDRISGEHLGNERFITNPKTGVIEFPERSKLPSHGGSVSCQVCHMENIFFDPQTRINVAPNNRGIAERISKGKTP